VNILEHIKIELGTHKEVPVIQFIFDYNPQIIKDLKAAYPVKYSATKRMWYLPDTPQYRAVLNLPPKLINENYIKLIHPNNQDTFRHYREELQLKAYSPNTVKTYTGEFAQTLIAFKHHEISQVSTEQIRSYLHYCVTHLKLTEGTMQSRINAIKFYFVKILKRADILLPIPRPKMQQQLPKSLSTGDIKKLFNVIENTKHLIILKLVYGMGLRVSEVVNLLISDIDTKRMQVHIRCAKGKRDRYTNLPVTLVEELREYYKLYKPKHYLIEGKAGGQYTTRSVQQIFKTAMLKARINKQVGVHGLRHSFATHLHEAGVDIAFVQELLGHSNIKTTLIYTKVSVKNIRNIPSPLDSI
jgi:integrase/recombinase XerD